MSLRLLLPLKKYYSSMSRFSRLSTKTGKTAEESEVKDEPIKFSTSEAGKWKAVYTNRGKDYEDMPKSQPMAILLSLTAVLVWFGILREENDWDDYLREIEDSIPIRMEEARLRDEIKMLKTRKLDASSVEARLQIIVQKRENYEKNKQLSI